MTNTDRLAQALRKTSCPNCGCETIGWERETCADCRERYDALASLAPAADVVRRAQDAYEDATGFADYRNGEKGMRAALAVAYPTLTAQVAALTAQRKDAERPLGKPSDYTFGPLETLEEIRATLKHCERHCPCGARPESLRTHPHVIGCPVPKTLRTVDTAIDSAIAAGNGEGMA